MVNRQSLILILLLLTSILRGQDYDAKSLGIGLNTKFPFYFSRTSSFNEARIPGLPLSPNLLIALRRHEIMLGTDIYPSSGMTHKYLGYRIYGLQMGYKYFLLKNDKKLNLLVECNLHYVQYGEGLVMAVQYNYLPTEWPTKDYNMIRTKSFVNTFGIGVRRTFFKQLGLQFVLCGGYNYYNSNYSPTNTTHAGLRYRDLGNTTAAIAFLEFGISFKFWKEKQILKP